MSANAQLANVQCLSRLGQNEQHAFVQALAAPEQYRPNRVLLRPHTPAPGVYIILSGIACRYIHTRSGQRQILGYLVPGDLCDVRTCFAHHTDFSMQSLSAVEATWIPTHRLEGLAERFPQLMRELWRLVTIEEATTRQWLLNVGRRNAVERLAHLLCECLARLHVTALCAANSCFLPITQRHIADALALSPVHVNRTLMELRRAGLILLKGHRLTIPDLQALQAVAGFDPAYLQLDCDSSNQSVLVGAESARTLDVPNSAPGSIGPPAARSEWRPSSQ